MTGPLLIPHWMQRQYERGKDPMTDKRNAKLLDLIPKGRGNAIGMKDLAMVLGISERETRKAIHKARLDGEVICGTDAGYYKPGSDAEAWEYITIASARCLSGLKALKAARTRYGKGKPRNGKETEI